MNLHDLGALIRVVDSHYPMIDDRTLGASMALTPGDAIWLPSGVVVRKGRDWRLDVRRYDTLDPRALAVGKAWQRTRAARKAAPLLLGDGLAKVMAGGVYCMDVLDFLRSFPEDSIDVIFADPPYNNGTQYAGYDDNRDDYKAWCAAWFAECRRVAKRIVITPGHGNLFMWGEIEKPFGVGCWHKPGNPASSVMGWETWEPYLYYCKGSGMLGGPSAIEAPVSNQKNVGNHPCPKSLLFMKKLLLKVGKAGNLVVDPFAGTGTTLVAARDCGMQFIGNDQSAEYVTLMERRLAQPYTPDMFAA